MRMTKIYYYEEHVEVNNGKGQRGNNHQKKIAANNSNASNGGHHKKNNQKQNQCKQSKGNANGRSNVVNTPEPRDPSYLDWHPSAPRMDCPGSYTVQNGVRTVEAEFVEVHHSGLINCAKRLIGWN